MKQMTGVELMNKVVKNPAWCLSITEPIVITTPVALSNSSITHLSPLLHFKGHHATFFSCRDLENACGTFYGSVDFSSSGIKSTEGLKVLGNTSENISANFADCPYLKVLEGEYVGTVVLNGSSIKDIRATVTGGVRDHPLIPKGHKFLINYCLSLRPHEKYLSIDYQSDAFFFDKCKKVKLRNELSRFGESKEI